MQNNNSKFIVNIVPLQNVISNTSGLSEINELSNAVGNIQQMINFDTKSILTNYLGAFTPATSIQVTSPLNLSNVGITSNNIPVTGTSGSTSTVNTLTSPSKATFINLFDTNQAILPAVSIGIASNQVFQIGGTGNALYYDATKTASEFRISSMNFIADLGNFSTVVVGGSCYAHHFVTLSDERAKYDISPLSDMSTITRKIQGINAYSFKYKNSCIKEFGLLAQELEGLFPECVETNEEYKYVKYNSVLALLLGMVRSLSERVDALESGLASA